MSRGRPATAGVRELERLDRGAPLDPAAPMWRGLPGGGPEGNARLTGITGLLLIVLLAVEGVTIVRIGQLITLHMFLGMLLIGPIALKLASTGYKFVGYYSGRESYRRIGPPPIGLRALGPAVVITTVVMMVSGVVLLLAGPSSRDSVLPIHKVSFIVWVFLTAVHVLAHLEASWTSARSELGAPRGGRSSVLAGRNGRMLVLGIAVLAGVVLAVLVIPDFASWQHFHPHHFRGDG